MTGEQIPKARIRRRRIFRLIWVVPAVALGVAAYLIWQHMRTIGPEVSITFPDASGLRVGQTPINYRGVQIGEVIGISLADDRRHEVVKARLHKLYGEVLCITRAVVREARTAVETVKGRVNGVGTA